MVYRVASTASVHSGHVGLDIGVAVFLAQRVSDCVAHLFGVVFGTETQSIAGGRVTKSTQTPEPRLSALAGGGDFLS